MIDTSHNPATKSGPDPFLELVVTWVYNQMTDKTSDMYLPKVIKNNHYDPYSAGDMDLGSLGIGITLKLSDVNLAGLSNALITAKPNLSDQDVVTANIGFGLVSDWQPLNLTLTGSFSASNPGKQTLSGTITTTVKQAVAVPSIKVGLNPKDQTSLLATALSIVFSVPGPIGDHVAIEMNTGATDIWNQLFNQVLNSENNLKNLVQKINDKLNDPENLEQISKELTKDINQAPLFDRKP